MDYSIHYTIDPTLHKQLRSILKLDHSFSCKLPRNLGENSFLIVASKEDKPCGFAHFVKIMRTIWVNVIYCSPLTRKQGVSSGIMEFFLSKLRGKEIVCNEVVATILAGSKSNFVFEKMGFTYLNDNSRAMVYSVPA